MATSTSPSSSSAPFINVCNKELSIKDFYPVYDKVKPLSSRWKSIAISFRLRIDTIRTIKANYPGDAVSCLQEVLECWLKKDYDDYQTNENSATPETDEVAMSPASTDRSTVYIHRPEINHPLAKKIYELQDVFADALQLTMESFLKKPALLSKILNYLTMHVHALLGPIRKNNPAAVQAVREEFSDIKTMTDLFVILQDKYVSWFNYELIIKLVRVFLSDNRTLKRTWSAYEEKLKDYFINSELITTYQLDPHQADSNGQRPIHYAAKSGDILLLELYVKDYKCSLSLTDHKGWNVIHFSSLKGHTHFIKHITSQYPQYISLLHSTDNEGQVPLHLTCESGNIQLVTFLKNEMKCDINAKDARDETCVTFACFSGNLDLVQLLTQQYKLEPLVTDKYGFTALHGAAENGHTHILKWYSQEYSVDITNHTNNYKYTLAHSAAYGGKLHCLQELINKYQCDVNATLTDTDSTVLHKACEGGHVPVVLYLTSLPQCNVAAKTSNGSTVLHITCEYSNSLPILKHLVENHQLDLCAVNDEGMAPIHLACSDGRLNLIQYIIEHIPSSLELPDTNDGRTPFLIAVYFNQLEVIKYLISKKCNLSATNDAGSGAVHISVKKGHLNVLKYLIDNNYCNPNATEHQDRTPLHVAVSANEYEILEYLLSKSIPSMSVVWLREIKLDSPHDIYNNPHNAVLINEQDKDGNTPLHYACVIHQNMVSLLLKASLSNNNLLITNKKGQTPLHLAAASGHKDTAEALLFSVTGSSTHHDLLTATDNEGSTVLHTACSNGHIDVFHYLSSIYPQVDIYHYLEPNIVSNPVPKDKSGRTPLHYASRSDNIRMVRYLIETFPCTPDDPDNNGYTSVHGACEAGSMELVQYFLTDLKCNALAETDDCKTMLYFASKSSNLELVRFLVDVFSLKPRPHDIEIAQSVNPDSSVVKYLQKIHFDLFLSQQSKVSGYYEKLEGQQVDPLGQDIVS
ncbi:PREDICTED: ankyrin-1-like [Amphimedon queenslandica]|uniref:Death domain-containing protein n=1 Tax=Amphimedon queenslandica TaxID=400682 RepID=A0AAN0JQ52_AMPQE|nr:PREDICTED: ankyrin-1-like [Amphimedon queenslandica]|eukprot:XP_019858946.1 PREDICTED: ankyrin-1-like [Amphimedon queenslandica]